MANVLYVGNKNYSSWSLRPWLVLTWGKIPFETRLVPLGGEGYGERRMPDVLAVSPQGSLPVLHADGEVICDSLAISEWAAERSPDSWPRDAVARAHARAATCEMHAGFGAIRANLPCNIRRRAEPRAHSAAVAREVARVDALFCSLRERFGAGGPYLFGPRPTIADAFYLPIATRFRTYGVALSPVASAYVEALLRDPDFLVWERDAIDEPLVMAQWDSA
ncbi:MAG: glutathione S-transferase [Myxococcales bacterium]|jgi:glutathione S-transferase|nr:glutathione S-transferase [Myxococcales bacterium]